MSDFHFVFDTTVLRQDFYLESSKYREFLSTARKYSWTISIPAVVIQEAVNLFRRTLEESITRIEREVVSIRKVARRLDRELAPSLVEQLRAETKRYETELRDRLDRLGITVIPYPDVTHSSLVDRILDGRKPFGKSDRGYRDYLIWRSVLAVAQQCESHVVLISANSSDFADGEILDKDLVEEATAIIGSSDRISYVPSVAKCLDIHKPTIAAEPEASRIESIVRGQFCNIDFVEWFSRNVNVELDLVDDVLKASTQLPAQAVHADVSVMREPTIASVDSLSEIDQWVYMTIRYELEVILKLDYELSSVILYERLRDLVGDDIDDGWTYTELENVVTVSVDIVVDTEFAEVVEYEVSEVEAKSFY
jgi:predicted nucleic acid-binding protein